MTLWDAGGLVGALLILVAYALVQMHRLDQRGAVSLLMNFAGSSLILLSLTRKFNLSAALIEAAWALVSLAGLLALAWRRRRG